MLHCLQCNKQFTYNHSKLALKLMEQSFAGFGLCNDCASGRPSSPSQITEIASKAMQGPSAWLNGIKDTLLKSPPTPAPEAEKDVLAAKEAGDEELVAEDESELDPLGDAEALEERSNAEEEVRDDAPPEKTQPNTASEVSASTEEEVQSKKPDESVSESKIAGKSSRAINFVLIFSLTVCILTIGFMAHQNIQLKASQAVISTE